MMRMLLSCSKLWALMKMLKKRRASPPIIGKDVIEEYEANEFTYSMKKNVSS